MSKMFTGSICLTDLLEKAKQKHSGFNKSDKNGKIYANVILWENDEVDKYGNTHSMQLSSKKDFIEQEGKIYIGNFKPSEKKEPSPLNERDISNLPNPEDDLPF